MAKKTRSGRTFIDPGLGKASGPGEVRLVEGSELSHARTVRVKTGETVILTDGMGKRWEATVDEVKREHMECVLTSEMPPQNLLPVRLWAPAGNRDRSLWLVEKAVEIGVRSVTWIVWERSRSVADFGKSENFVARASARAASAMKQSGGSWLPHLSGPVEWRQAADWFAARRGRGGAGGAHGWLGDPNGTPAVALARRGMSRRSNEDLIVAVGPEGGLLQPERDRCIEAGFHPVSLGAANLRFETAAVGLLAMASAILETGRLK